jgi:serine/threonine protein kinase
MSKLPIIEGYSIVKKLGSGSFGTVYKAHDNEGKFYAIKVESKKQANRLEHEKGIYDNLGTSVGFPKIYSIIKDRKHNTVIMDYLGPSLEDLFDFCGNKFSIKTVLMIGIQVLNRIEALHNSGYLHRDIKPDNFLIGTSDKKSRIYMIDLGLSKRYMKDNNHIEYHTNKSFTGSFRYSSIRNHRGIEQSRRDDLESIGYMLIFFAKGCLPWQGLKGSTKSKRSANILNVKNSKSLEDLCEDLPREFLLYMKYCRLLRFPQKPDYVILRDLLINLFKNNKYTLDFIYDWNIVAKRKKNEISSNKSS